MKYYLAYGSNLNIKQMKKRCPNAEIVGSAVIYDYELVFKGCLTIEPKVGSVVPVGIWKITKECEKSLDHYEGYPSFYRKEEFKVNYNDKKIKALIYIMNGSRYPTKPSPYYYNAVLEGYKDFNFKQNYLISALNNCQ